MSTVETIPIVEWIKFTSLRSARVVILSSMQPQILAGCKADSNLRGIPWPSFPPPVVIIPKRIKETLFLYDVSQLCWTELPKNYYSLTLMETAQVVPIKLAKGDKRALSHRLTRTVYSEPSWVFVTVNAKAWSVIPVERTYKTVLNDRQSRSKNYREKCQKNTTSQKKSTPFHFHSLQDPSRSLKWLLIKVANSERSDL